jgi:hypothetical protein
MRASANTASTEDASRGNEGCISSRDDREEARDEERHSEMATRDDERSRKEKKRKRILY